MDLMISLGQKNTLAEYMILSGADNHLPMLDKDLYDSWKSRMELYIQNREHRRKILESVENGPLIWPTVEENGVIRTKKYAELSVSEKIQAECDMKATNIILQGLPSDIYSLERECKLYDASDKFTHIKGQSLYTYYLQFTQSINDMNIYKMKMEQFQVNTKFLNSLPPEWSKFVTDVKLVKDLHTSNFDQLHAYLEQHELYANKVCIMCERNQDPLAFVANQQMTLPHFNPYQSSYNNPQLQQQFSPSQHASIQPNQHYSSYYPSEAQFNHSSIPPSHTFQSQMNHQTSTIPQVTYQSPQAPTKLMIESSFVDSGFVVPVFSPGDDLIACLNKAMTFLNAIASLRFPSTNNQLRTSSNPRNQATIQDGRVTVQQVQGRQRQNYSGITYKGNATSSKGNTTSGQARAGAGQILDEEQLAFLADTGIPASQTQTIIPHNIEEDDEDEVEAKEEDEEEIEDEEDEEIGVKDNDGKMMMLRVESSSSKRLKRNDMRMDSFNYYLTALDSTFREQMQEMKKLVAGLNEQFQQIQERDLRAKNEMLRIRWRAAEERAKYNHMEAKDNAVRADVASDRGGESVDTTAIVKDAKEEKDDKGDAAIAKDSQPSEIEAAIRAERERVREEATRAGGLAGGLTAAPVAQECTFAGFMKCGPMQFHRTEGAVRLCRWFEKIESTFGINIDEFYPTKEVQRLEDELRHLKLRDMNIAAYTKRFNELALLCLDDVPNEKKKVELYIKRLPEIIKGETTSSRPAMLNEAVRMAHTLMEQKIHANNEKIAEGNKRRWENNNQGRNNNRNNNDNRNNYNNRNNCGNYCDNNHHNQYNQKRQDGAKAMTAA
ncbi:hypothetical protein Tco_0517917 [Tanacetum coccineum]